MKHFYLTLCLTAMGLIAHADTPTNLPARPIHTPPVITNVATVVYTNSSGVVITETTNSIGQVKRSYQNPVRTLPVRPAPGPRISHTNTVKSATAKTNTLVLASWFDPACTSKAYFQEKVLPELKSGGGYTPYPISTYAFRNDWFIKITDAGSYESYDGTEQPDGDMISTYSPSSGLYRRYLVQASPEEQVGEYGSVDTNITFTIYDPSGVVASFTNNVITGNGQANGTVTILGTDSNGVSKTATVVLTKVASGGLVSQYAYESDQSSRYILNTNIISKLMSISTAPADMVTYDHCRSAEHRTSKGFESGFTWTSADHWACPRQLSRFGTAGRIVTNEWSWSGSGVEYRRVKCSKVNQDFFWPELWDSLRPFSIDVHEAQTSTYWTGWMPYLRLIVAPHYALEVGHYGGVNTFSRFYSTSGFSSATMTTKVSGNAASSAKLDRDLGLILMSSSTNSYADARLFRMGELSQPFGSSNIAKFASRDLIQRLSPSMFRYSIAFTLTDHQTVNPFVLGSPGTILSSWYSRPNESTCHMHHHDTQNQDISTTFPGWQEKLASVEHMTHMFDSGDIVFLATPRAQIIPLFMFTTVSGGTFIPNFLENLDRMIKQDSVATFGTEESLSYWTFDELYWGGTNSVSIN